MRYLYLPLIACAALLVSGCDNLAPTNAPEQSAAPAVPVSAPPQPDRFEELQSTLDQEVEQARAAQQEAVDAMQKLPPRQRATAGDVQIKDVEITDSQSGETRTLHALQSVSVTLPLAAKRRPEYDHAMEALKNLANALADSRGSSSIVVDQAQADVRAHRVNTATGTTQTSNGKPVTVLKNIDRALPRGAERYTIQAGELHDQP